jgi:hypothetical protein
MLRIGEFFVVLGFGLFAGLAHYMELGVGEYTEIENMSTSVNNFLVDKTVFET